MVVQAAGYLLDGLEKLPREGGAFLVVGDVYGPMPRNSQGTGEPTSHPVRPTDGDRPRSDQSRPHGIAIRVGPSPEPFPHCFRP